VSGRADRAGALRDSGNTILAKEFRGGVLVMTGANSAVGLRSMPVRYLFLDEVDGYPLDVEGEGDAISLAEARTRTFARRKIFIVSTPTMPGRAPSSASTRPATSAATSCRARTARTGSGCASSNCAGRRASRRPRPTSASPATPPIAEHHKTWMLEHGEWRAWHRRTGKTAGFHLSSSTARSAGAAGATLPPPGKRGEQGVWIGGGDQDLQEHRTR
jgi:phage terminase large subunit GpA-like protein